MEDRRRWTGLLYILPALLVITVFTIYPLVRTFFLSSYVGFDLYRGTFEAYGWDNYQYILQDEVFYKALKNTFTYVLFVVPASVILSLLIAVALNANIKFRSFFQTVFFLPYVTSTVAVGIVWSWIFHSRYGLLNYFLGLVGMEPLQWLNQPKMAMSALIIFSIWKGLAFNIVIFLAGLQNIDSRYYEAAQVDSASKRRVFFKVTVPLLSPMIAYAFIMELISSFKVYTEVFALFGGKAGPANSAMTLVYYIYDKFYGNWDFGVASAAAVLLFAIILLFTLIQLWVSKKKVFY